MSEVVAVASSSEGASRVGLVDLTSSKLSPSPIRLCITCAFPISAARLKAKPFATQCVPCLEAAGDVAPVRRLDEQTGGDTIETYYSGQNFAIERVVRRTARSVPGSKFLSDMTEAPLMLEKLDTRGVQTTTEIICGVEELDI